jgi:hypothetical protein
VIYEYCKLTENEYVEKRKKCFGKAWSHDNAFSDEIVPYKDNKNIVMNDHRLFLKRYASQNELNKWYKEYFSFTRIA